MIGPERCCSAWLTAARRRRLDADPLDAIRGLGRPNSPRSTGDSTACESWASRRHEPTAVWDYVPRLTPGVRITRPPPRARPRTISAAPVGGRRRARRCPTYQPAHRTLLVTHR